MAGNDTSSSDALTTLHPIKNPLRGRLKVPGDKSISHRSVMLSSVSEGRTQITGFLHAADTLSTVGVFQALGVDISVDGTEVIVEGRGKEALTTASAPLDCGNSGTTMRLMTGLLAGLKLPATLIGDASLSKRPMGRVADPLTALGARVETQGGRPPVRILAEGEFRGGDQTLKVASAQVKSCMMLAALMSGRPMRIVEPQPSRDHSEVMLRALGVPVWSSAHYRDLNCQGPAEVRLPAWEAPLRSPGTLEVPGDISSAAFIAVAAALVPDSAVVMPGVGVTPTRAGVLAALARAGAPCEVMRARQSAGGEPCGDIAAGYAPLKGFEITAAEVPTLIDEIPALGVLAARATGRSHFHGIEELRVKESDRLAMTAELLTRCGVTVETGPDWMIIEGQGDAALKAFTFDAAHDHRMAAAAILASLVADGPCHLQGIDCLAVSYPALREDLAKLAN